PLRLAGPPRHGEYGQSPFAHTRACPTSPVPVPLFRSPESPPRRTLADASGGASPPRPIELVFVPWQGPSYRFQSWPVIFKSDSPELTHGAGSASRTVPPWLSLPFLTPPCNSEGVVRRIVLHALQGQW